MPINEKRKFQQRMANRTFRHGKNWRQIFVDFGGMCYICYSVDALEFHEPFGEDRYGWGTFQSRLLICFSCHCIEHDKENHGRLLGSNRAMQPSMLSEDVNMEIIMEGGYDNWIKNHKLIDRLGWILCQKGDFNGQEHNTNEANLYQLQG